MASLDERQQVLDDLVAAAGRIAAIGFDDAVDGIRSLADDLERRDTWDVGPVFIKGTPRAQGSKKGYFNPKNPKVPILVESSKQLPGWRANVRAAMEPLMEGRALLDGPLEVRAVFTFQRPQGHHVAGDRSRPLKAGAPTYHTGKPDLSKLLRGYEDDLSGLVWTDDARIARYLDPVKLWGSQPGMELAIRRIRE